MSEERLSRAASWGTRLTSPGGLFLTAVLLLGALPLISEIRDPDFWWHLRAGQLILERHALLGNDPFTYTVPASRTWTMHEWLTEVMFAALHSLGGLGAIVLVLSAVTWLGVLAIFARARLSRPHHLPLGLGMIIAVVAGYPIWGPRAQMITFALSCLTLLLAERHLRRGGRLVWLLPPTFLIWSNLHSGFIIGLGFLALIVLAEVVSRPLRLPDGAPGDRVRSLAAVFAACLLASFVNPNGPGIVLYPFATQGSGAQQQVIQEWHSPNFHLPELHGFEAMLLTLVVAILVNRRIRGRDAALLLATTVLALQSVRHVALFVAAVTPIWIEQIDRAWQSLRQRAARSRRSPSLHPAAKGRWVRQLTFAMVGGLLVAGVLSRLVSAAKVDESAAAYARDYPVCAARWLSAAPAPLRVFNQYGEGGYLAYALSARGDRVFIFGDAALMGDELLVTYGDIESVKPSWDELIRRSRTDVVLFDRGTPLTELLDASPRWTKVYSDDLSAAYVLTARAAALHLPSTSRVATAGTDTCPAARNQTGAR